MFQTDRGSYNRDTYSNEVKKSCFGRVIMLGTVLGILLAVAHVTVPSEQRVYRTVYNSIILCILSNIEQSQDAADDFIRNISSTITKVDSTKMDIEPVRIFNKHNKIEVYPHAFYSTARVHTVSRPEGVRVGLAFFGIVFPTVSAEDYLLNVDPVQKDYKDGVIGRKMETEEESEDLGFEYDEDFNPFPVGDR